MNEVDRSNQSGELSNRGGWIRTSDLGHPKAARYQAAPRPDAKRV